MKDPIKQHSESLRKKRREELAESFLHSIIKEVGISSLRIDMMEDPFSKITAMEDHVSVAFAYADEFMKQVKQDK